MAKKGRLYALRQEHNPLVYLCGPWLQIKESKKADLKVVCMLLGKSTTLFLSLWALAPDKGEQKSRSHKRDTCYTSGICRLLHRPHG